MAVPALKFKASSQESIAPELGRKPRYNQLLTENPDGTAFIRTVGGEIVMGRKVDEHVYEISFLFSPPVQIDVLGRADKHVLSLARAQLRDAFSGTLSHWSGRRSMRISPLAVPELEVYTPADRFFRLAPSVEDVNSLDFLGLETAFIEAPDRVGITQIPAFRVTEAEGEVLCLDFGHLKKAPDTESGWVINNHAGPMEVNNSTYFRS